MLRQLRIGNLALVTDLAIPLGAGLTILTGETGAGKSLIAGALGLLAGGKGDRQQIRQGEELAFVEGVFELEGRPDLQGVLAEAGVTLGADGVLVLRREFRREGRGRILVNGLVSSLAVLERIGPRLLGIQSQDQQRQLSQPDFAGEFLDRMIGAQPLLDDLAAARRLFLDLQERLERRRQEEEFARQQLEIWEYQLRELREARLDRAEEERLTEQIHFGRNARQLLEAAGKAGATLCDGETNVRQLLGRALGALRPLEGSGVRLDGVISRLRDAEGSVAEAAADLERFLDGVDVDPAKLDELEERQALYQDLRRKYHRDVPELLELQAQLEQRVSRQQVAGAEIAKMAGKVEEACGGLAAAAAKLRELRRQQAPAVAGEAEDVVRPLSLPDLEFRFAVIPDLDPAGETVLDGERCRVGGRGADRITLQVRTNLGEAWGEVHRIASGGERSRIFLGLSVLVGRGRQSPFLLFDEIDAGLGMDGAVPVAELLRALAAGGQVLCITHLATVAARGRAHLKAAKRVESGRTVLDVYPLAGPDRLQEIARLLGGEKGGGTDREEQIAYARQLLATVGAPAGGIPKGI